MHFKIFEGNMELLEKKLKRIKNKCEKYGNEFHYEKIGEDYISKVNDEGVEETLKFIVVDVQGKAIVNNWKFIGTIDHTEKGNIIRKFSDEEVPERYYTTASVCEHCKSNRRRKNTFLIVNIETGDFKQVGKSCLKDFTNGMDAEYVASYISLFDSLIEGESIGNLSSSSYHSYISMKEALCYISETIRHFGYVKADGVNPTKTMASDFYRIDKGHRWTDSDVLKDEMEQVGFDAGSEYARNKTEDALSWILLQDESNNYMHNLKTVCSLEYIDYNQFGILASLFPAYDRYLEHEKKVQKEQEDNSKSDYVGKIGDRITIKVANFDVVTSWHTQFGWTGIYKIVDEDGNVYTWKTSSGIEEGTNEIVATVKAHNEYRGNKQTEITRCRCKRMS